MKNLFLTTMTFAILLLTGFANNAQAQDAKPTKEETVQYISNLYSKTKWFYTFSGEIMYKGISVSLDGKILEVKNLWSGDGEKIYRYNLKEYFDKTPLKVTYDSDYKIYYGGFLDGFQTEDEAKRACNALNHLIELVKNDKSDPFDVD